MDLRRAFCKKIRLDEKSSEMCSLAEILPGEPKNMCRED